VGMGRVGGEEQAAVFKLLNLVRKTVESAASWNEEGGSVEDQAIVRHECAKAAFALQLIRQGRAQEVVETWESGTFHVLFQAQHNCTRDDKIAFPI